MKALGTNHVEEPILMRCNHQHTNFNCPLGANLGRARCFLSMCVWHPLGYRIDKKRFPAHRPGVPGMTLYLQ